MVEWCEKIVTIMLEGFFRITKIKVSKERMDSILQFVKFGVVGLSNTVVSYLIYLIVIVILNKLDILQSINYIIANTIAFLLSVLWSFFWNQKYVFKMKNRGKGDLLRALLKTYVTYLFTGLILNNILSIFWVSVVKISVFVAPIFNLVMSIPINFLLNKFWAFK